MSLPADLSSVTVYTSGVVTASRADVWRVLRCWGTSAWLKGEGSLTFTVLGEDGRAPTEVGSLRLLRICESQMFQQLTAVDDDEHAISWKLISHPRTVSPFPEASFVNHAAYVRLRSVTTTGDTFLEWKDHFFTEPHNVHQMQTELQNWCLMGLRNLEAYMSRQQQTNVQSHSTAAWGRVLSANPQHGQPRASSTPVAPFETKSGAPNIETRAHDGELRSHVSMPSPHLALDTRAKPRGTGALRASIDCGVHCHGMASPFDGRQPPTSHRTRQMAKEKRHLHPLPQGAPSCQSGSRRTSDTFSSTDVRMASRTLEWEAQTQGSQKQQAPDQNMDSTSFGETESTSVQTLSKGTSAGDGGTDSSGSDVQKEEPMPARLRAQLQANEVAAEQASRSAQRCGPARLNEQAVELDASNRHGCKSQRSSLEQVAAELEERTRQLHKNKPEPAKIAQAVYLSPFVSAFEESLQDGRSSRAMGSENASLDKTALLASGRPFSHSRRRAASPVMSAFGEAPFASPFAQQHT